MVMAETETRRPARSGPRGEVHVLVARCKGCGFCVEFCPTHVLEMSTDYNAKGYHYPLVVRPGACTGCDLCGMVCPDFAVFGVRKRKATAASADRSVVG